MDKETRRLLDEADWERIALELGRYTLNLLKCYPWRTGNFKEPIAGLTYEDIVLDAIGRTFNGSRTWNPQQGDLLKFLKYNVVRSMVSNLVESSEYAVIASPKVRDEDGLMVPDFEGYLESPYCSVIEACSHHSAESDAIENEKLRHLEELYANVLKHVEKDKEATDVVYCLMEGITKPQEIAEATGLDPRRISEVKRKITNIFRKAQCATK